MRLAAGRAALLGSERGWLTWSLSMGSKCGQDLKNRAGSQRVPSRVAPDEPLELRVDRQLLQLLEVVILRRRRCCARSLRRILASRRVDVEFEGRIVGQYSRAPRTVGGSKVVEQLALDIGHLPAYGAGTGALSDTLGVT